jgi:hypothetical protein
LSKFRKPVFLFRRGILLICKKKNKPRNKNPQYFLTTPHFDALANFNFPHIQQPQWIKHLNKHLFWYNADRAYLPNHMHLETNKNTNAISMINEHKWKLWGKQIPQFFVSCCHKAKAPEYWVKIPSINQPAKPKLNQYSRSQCQQENLAQNVVYGKPSEDKFGLTCQSGRRFLVRSSSLMSEKHRE